MKIKFLNREVTAVTFSGASSYFDLGKRNVFDVDAYRFQLRHGGIVISSCLVSSDTVAERMIAEPNGNRMMVRDIALLTGAS